MIDANTVAPMPDTPVDVVTTDDGVTGAAYQALLLNRSALRDLPDPQPLIANVLDKGTCALLYGYRGTLKSFIALDWAASVATGRAWQGREVQPCRVLYVAAEGAFGLKARVAAWEVGWRTTIDDAVLSILPRPVNLTVAHDVANLAALIRDGGYGFVVLDTLARCMVGADENSARDTGVVVDSLYRLLDHTPGRRGQITGVHHTGKDGRTLRGSSAFDAGVDTVYAVARDGAVVTLNREKRKDGPESDRHELKLDLIEGTGSGVIGASKLSNWSLESSPHAEALLSTFRQHFSNTGATNTQLRKTSELSEGSYYRARRELLKRGELVNDGTEKRPFYTLGSK